MKNDHRGTPLQDITYSHYAPQSEADLFIPERFPERQTAEAFQDR